MVGASRPGREKNLDGLFVRTLQFRICQTRASQGVSCQQMSIFSRTTRMFDAVLDTGRSAGSIAKRVTPITLSRDFNLLRFRGLRDAHLSAVNAVPRMRAQICNYRPICSDMYRYVIRIF